MVRVPSALLAACMLAGLPTAHAAAAKPKRRAPAQYKRVHFQPMRLLEAGKAKQAAAWCARHLERYPDEPETLYCQAIAQAQLGRADEAAATVRKAVAAGLPLGRFLAGPRRLVETLVNSPAFKTLLAEQPCSVVHGPMLGCLTDRSAKFWVRTAVPAAVRVDVAATQGQGPAIPSSTARTSKQTDFTAVVEVTGLKPSTEYAYNVALDGNPLPTPKRPRFVTYPPAAKPTKFQVAFGGGAGYVPPHERMWNVIASHHPLALLLLGDNVYIDLPKSPLMQRYCYYRRQSRPEFRRLVASAAVYAIYDDHDFGTNDCIPGPDIREPAWKVPVWNVFRQNWNNPAYGGGQPQPGCWFNFSIGDVDFILTDGRFYRNRPRKGDPATFSMLGPVQKAWLLKRLAAAKGTFKVLIAGVPWSKGTKGGSPDTWDGFAAEREEIFAFINQHKIDGVILLAADRHRSDVWKTERPNGYPLYEFESSRLTNQHRHGKMKGALFSYNEKQSFGLLTFDTTLPDPTVTYQIINLDDQLIHTFTLKKSHLTHR